MAKTKSRTRTQAARPLLLRLGPAQRAALREAAGAMGVTESAYLRRALSVVLRLDAFTSEPPLYQQWFRQGLADLYVAANLVAVTAQALLSLERERRIESAEVRGLSTPLATEEADAAIATAMAAGREVLVDPEIRAVYRALVPEPAVDDETFWQEVDHGREPPIEGE